MYSDTLDMDISFDVPVCRLALLSRKTFDVPARRLDAKGLSGIVYPIRMGYVHNSCDNNKPDICLELWVYTLKSFKL